MRHLFYRPKTPPPDLTDRKGDIMANWKRYYKDKVEIDGQLYEVTPEDAAFIRRVPDTMNRETGG